MTFKDSRTRNTDLPMEMAGKYGQPIGHEAALKHARTHQHMADLTAISRQTVCAVLNETS